MEDTTGARIREARKAQGMEQKELAERMGISAAFLSRIERGERGCSLELLRAAAEVLGRSMADLAQERPATERQALDDLLDLTVREHPEVALYLRRLAGRAEELSEGDRRFLADHLKLALGQADEALRRRRGDEAL